MARLAPPVFGPIYPLTHVAWFALMALVAGTAGFIAFLGSGIARLVS